MPSKQHHDEQKYLRPRVDIANFAPCHEDRVLVKRLPWPETERGLIVPEIAKRRDGVQLGEVVSVGRGRTYSTNLSTGKIKHLAPGVRDEFSVKPGDKVLYARHCTQEFEDGEWGTYTFGYEEQFILAIYEEKKDEFTSAS